MSKLRIYVPAIEQGAFRFFTVPRWILFVDNISKSNFWIRHPKIEKYGDLWILGYREISSYSTKPAKSQNSSPEIVSWSMKILRTHFRNKALIFVEAISQLYWNFKILLILRQLHKHDLKSFFFFFFQNRTQKINSK